ncbi:hypothetical protein H2200_002289 [Cladophialophora chaetospira]|uniref:Mus7/MMS22 family protein n=1 Tax=Cladophialophora chaetospira TaxID=386627 RepID=A0AA39CND9_9EURO|nr:hypothetical protein H2200_002289 [Cladophialophora chaetospira]
MANWRERGYVPDSDDDEEDDRDGYLPRQTSRAILAPKHEPIHVPPPSQDATSDGDDNPPDAQHTTTEQHDEAPVLDDDVELFAQDETKNLTEPDPEDGHRQLLVSLDSIPTSTAAKLEAEIQKGLKTVQDVLGSLPSPLHSDIDSPLSSAPSSPSTPWKSSAKETVHGVLVPSHIDENDSPAPVPANRGNGPSPSPLSEVQRAAPAKVLGPRVQGSDVLLLDEAPRRRSFRPRAPIQVHPYALEDARYRQTWTARGLKPVRVPELASNAQETPKEDSQGTTAYQSSQADLLDASIGPSSPTMDLPQESPRVTNNDESQSPVRGLPVRRYSPMSDLDDDLPELSELIKNRAASSSGLKLARPKHSSRQESRSGIGGFKTYDLPDDDYIVRPLPRAHRRKSVSPLSPPRSRGGLSSQDGMLVQISDVQIGVSTPTLLPTPLVSSDRHGSKRTFAARFDDIDSEHDIVDLVNDTTASASSVESSNDESQGVQHMRRKIKGVLPASWLKLDMKQRHEPTRAARNQAQSPVKSILERGVAKHVASSARQAKHRAREPVLEEDMGDLETSSESGSELRAVDEMDGVQYDLPESFNDDVVEDNAIDAMLAPRVRKRPFETNQRRLSGVWSKKKTEKSTRSVGKEVFTSHRGNHIKVSLKSKKKARPLKRVKRKHAIRQMTILDAPGFDAKDVPRFLRIASRRTGDTSTVRQQNLSTKFFRMATIKDTEDVNSGLSHWRGSQGQLRSTARSSSGPRSRTGPVPPQRRRFDYIDHEEASNPAHDGQSHPQHVNDLDPQLRSLKQTTKATLDRIQNHQDQSRWLPVPNIATTPSAAQPPVILDYFQSGTSRRAQLQLSTPNRINQERGGGPEQRSNQINAFAVQKWVPQSARARRERRDHSPPRDPSTMNDTPPRASIHFPPDKRQDPPLSLALHPSRPPRKQQPVDLRLRNDVAFHQRDILFLQTLSLGDEKDIITYATRYPPCRNSLSNTSNPSGLLPVRSELIRHTLSSMADTARLFETQWMENTITTPKTQRTLGASAWSPVVEANLRDILTETFNIACKDAFASTLSTSEQTDLLNRAADSVETIITYVNTTLNFSREQELEAFLQLTSELMGKIWRGIRECEAATSGPRASHVLKILNGLLVFGYQLDQCANVLARPEAFCTKIEDSRKNLARLAWTLAVQEQHIGQLFAYIATQPGVGSPFGAEHANYIAELETIIFIDTFGPHRGWSFYMQDILSVDEGAGEIQLLLSRAEGLAYTVLILGCILSVVGSEGISSGKDSHSSTTLCLSLRGMLVSKISEFLKPYVEHKAKYSNRLMYKSGHVKRLEQFGLMMFRWCLLLIRNFLHDLADDLLKAMFKYYSECGMVELFGGSVQAEMDRMPQFLKDQLPPKDLVPEEGDSDFHIFLKLAGMTLTARPLADGGTVEQMRKLNLRKKSLLFLLLPNKGRDLAVDDLSIFDEDKDLTLTDFAGISNRYSLFVTLHHYAPEDSKPPISQISNYIDFPTAHEHVREVILACWANIVKSILLQSASLSGLHELGQWIRAMLVTVCEKLASIPNDSNITHHDETLRTQFHVHRINRKITLTCIAHVAERYTTAINLCANEEQVSFLLPREELSGLILRCYVDQGLGDMVGRQVFDLLTSYIKKGLPKNKEALRLFRQDLRGLLVDQLTRNKEQHGPDYELLLVSMTDAWHALGKVMVGEGSAHWHQFLHDWSAMSFPQIADVGSGRECQVLLMSKIAVERDLVLAEPYPFIDLLLKSVLKPVVAGSEPRFVHRLLNQLMESIPDAFTLEALRRNLSNGIEPFFLDKFDIMNHRLAIVDHFIRYAYVLRVAAEMTPATDLNDGQWNELTTMICIILKRTANEIHGETQSEWVTFAQKVLFRLNLYRGPGNGSETWSIDVGVGEVKTNAFRLERLFVRLPSHRDSVHLDNERAAKVFRSALETACLNTKEEDLVKHLVTVFSASDPEYVDDDGSFMLDLPQQMDFMKAVFPAYIGSALDVDRSATLLAMPVLDVATGIMTNLELRVDLESQARMESFAELITVLMRAAVTTMQQSFVSPLRDGTWQLGIIRRLVDLCSLGGGRWAHIYHLFPASATILAVQPLVQAYASYAYVYTCAVGGFDEDLRMSDLTSSARDKAIERWTVDFGFEIAEISVPEHIVALKNAAVSDLRTSGKDWHRAGFTTYGPVWELRRGASSVSAKAEGRGVRNGSPLMELQQAVVRLERVLVLLGVMEGVL